MDIAAAPVKKTPVIAGLILCVVLLILWELLTKLCIPLWFPGIGKANLFLASRLLFWAYLLALWLYSVKVEKQPLLLWGEQRYPFKFTFLSVISVMLVTMMGSAMINLIAKLFHLATALNVLSNFKGFSAALKLFTVITAAVAEELIFRGYLMPRLQLFAKSKWVPIIVSSLIFGLGHAAYGTFTNTAGPLLIGLVFGWYYQKYRNLKVLIICHFIIDFTALILVG